MANTSSSIIVHYGDRITIAMADIIVGHTSESQHELLSTSKKGVLTMNKTPIDITDPEYQISQMAATMAMAGFILTEEDKQQLRDIISGKLTAEEAIEQVKQKYNLREKGESESI